jgi:hypothetical protein
MLLRVISISQRLGGLAPSGRIEPVVPGGLADNRSPVRCSASVPQAFAPPEAVAPIWPSATPAGTPNHPPSAEQGTIYDRGGNQPACSGIRNG